MTTDLKPLTAAAATVIVGAAHAAEKVSVDELITKIKNKDDKVRGPAWQGAGPAGAAAVKPLAEVMSDSEFAAAVRGVQLGNHWWPFSMEIRTMDGIGEELLKAYLSMETVANDLAAAQTWAVKRENQWAFMLIDRWQKQSCELRDALKGAVSLLELR